MLGLVKERPAYKLSLRAKGRLFVGVGLGFLVFSVAAGVPAAGQVRTLATRGRVTALAADGDRVAFIVAAPYLEPGKYGRVFPCASVVVWEPMAGRVIRLQHPCGPGQDVSLREDTRAVTLAGTRAAWLHLDGGNTLETLINTATVARTSPATIAYGASNEGGDGAFPREPFGDGTLLAFTVDQRCDADAVLNQGPGAPNQCPPGRKTGYVTAATVWRMSGFQRCPEMYGVRRCSRVATADGELSVLAVDANRIVVQAKSGLRLLSAKGSVLQELDVRARSAQLSGARLAIRTTDAVEVYDTSSGQRTARFPAASALRLQDLDRDILVTASGGSVTLRRLGNGRTSTIRTAGTAFAQLESPGLFVAGDRRVTFTPMRDVLRQLGS